MFAYYNEIDPFAAQWLRNLMQAGRIMGGLVDERSIVEVQPEDLEGFTRCHFFAGIGVWDYALQLADWPEDRPVWTGSPPCQPFSGIGKQQGAADERHLWPEMFRLIQQCKPDVTFAEQVKAAIGLGWLDHVQADMEGERYAFAATVLPACGIGAPHLRERLYLVSHRLGNAGSTGLEGHPGDGPGGEESGRIDPQESRPAAETGSLLDRQAVNGFWANADWVEDRACRWRPVQPGLSPMVTRTANHVGRCRAYGNAVVAPLAAQVIKAYLAIE